MLRITTLLAAVLAASTAACASVRSQMGRQEALQRELDGYRHPQPMDQVWSETRRVLADWRFPLAGKDGEAVGQDESFFDRVASVSRETAPTRDGGRVLETGWTSGGVRYRAEAWSAEGGVRVVLTRIQEDTANHGHDRWSRRDPELELVLVRRLSPEAADAIEARLQAGGAPPPAGPYAPGAVPARAPAPAARDGAAPAGTPAPPGPSPGSRPQAEPPEPFAPASPSML